MQRFVDGLVIFVAMLAGFVAVLGLIGFSGYMNYQFVYLYDGVDGTELDRQLRGAAAVGMDIIKAVMLIYIVRAWRNRRYLYVFPAGFFFVLATSLSLVSATGYAAKYRSDTASTAIAHTKNYDDLQDALATAKDELSAIGKTRPVATVAADLAKQRQYRRWKLSKKCTFLKYKKSRAFCDGYATLKTELATAEAASEFRQEIKDVRIKIETVQAQRGAPKEARPQEKALALLTGYNITTVGGLLIALFAGGVEAATGFGLYFVFGHGKKIPPRDVPEPIHTAVAAPTMEVVPAPDKKVSRLLTVRNPVAQLIKYGDVADYTIARLEASEDQVLDVVDLHADYTNWCADAHLAALDGTQFMAEFGKMLDHFGYEIVDNGGQKMCPGITFKAASKAA